LKEPSFPRIVIAGTGGDSGKTLVSLALVRAATTAGLRVAAFKKGPDYIDSSWLQWASGSTARNLDTWLMGEDAVLESFLARASAHGLNVIEGNRGLFDGMDPIGSHSTASLARILGTPVILVVPVTKVTASISALVHGFATLDSHVNVSGVILNRVHGERHERVVREAVEKRAGVPVLGAVPKMPAGNLLPDRHLGLVPLHERDDIELVEEALDEVAGYLDLDAILNLARTAKGIEGPASVDRRPSTVNRIRDRDREPSQDVRIGVFRDAAFSFYYPENIEALEAAGAEIVILSPLLDTSLPDLDGLYIGGGFPETHAGPLSRNTGMLSSVRDAAESGMPVYAECGGLVYLSRSLAWRGETFSMTGVLPVDTEVFDQPQGHGYAEATAVRDNPFFETGARFRGHEFHYSTIIGSDPDTMMSLDILRGHGCGDGRCGIVRHNVFATYIHIHALGEPGWAGSVVGAARRWRGTNYKRVFPRSL